MDCVNHPGVAAAAYCQNCGKPLCAACIRHGVQGQILCDPCLIAWQQTVPHPFAASHSGPNPALAAILGFIPGVGAMYNGQFLKGFIHVIIFAVLVSMNDNFHAVGPLFGLLVTGWVFYQVFEAYQTAKARREGRPLPDPLGLNEAIHNWSREGNWSHHPRPPYPGQPGAAPPTGTNPASANPYTSGVPNPNPNPEPPYQGVYQGSYPADPYQDPYQHAQYQQPPYQAPYSTPFSPPPAPPIAPIPPPQWRRREPIAAIVLIALGILFLVGQLNVFSIRLFHFGWPLLLICLGAWLIARRFRDSQGGPQ